MTLYNPESTIVNIGGVEVTGFADGSFIKVKRTKDLYTLKSGAHGDSIFVKNPDRTGTISVTIISTFKTNDKLSALLLADEIAPNGTKEIPIIVKDTNGLTLCTGLGRLKGWPELERSVEEKPIEWTFLVRNLRMFLGGTDD
nr:hypothetical protein GTC16762_33480 [Pigmentibacter ruber]